ncbi:MAG: RIP metalloprotease RseP [Candidatus Margulisbacteria bacterium]|nr:RIP metalloprotease RseP [Candidatus Margulisiibacteriota bacterium]
MLLTILSFIFVFTVITLAHEFGHLVFAKRAGIAVPEFGLGFGPTIFSFSKNNTTYKINILPILGYVKIAGLDADEDQDKEIPEDQKFFNKKTSQKFMPIFAGALMNLILGFLVFSFTFMIIGVPIGISNELSAISPGSEAAKVGLKSGDRLLAINGKEYSDPEEAVKTIHENPDIELTLSIDRAGKKILIKATPKLNKKMKIGLIGFSLKAIYEKVGPLTAIYKGFLQTASLSLMILTLVGKLLTGGISLFDLAGPVGIAQITGQYASHGVLSLLSFLAFFSVNVAVLNLLPIPALDGGRLFFVLIEAIRHKAIPLELENKFHYVGLFALLGLLAVLTVNDLIRILAK